MMPPGDTVGVVARVGGLLAQVADSLILSTPAPFSTPVALLFSPFTSPPPSLCAPPHAPPAHSAVGPAWPSPRRSPSPPPTPPPGWPARPARRSARPAAAGRATAPGRCPRSRRPVL